MNNSYALITPARNEEAYIEKTIESVISQTILPKKWIIVSDGSTDSTEEIVRQYEAIHEFIKLVRLKPFSSRNFASRVYVLEAGVKQLSDIEYNFIGHLDADISLEPNYYEKVIDKFKHNTKLGIAGGIIYDKHLKKFHKQHASLNSVGGAIQMFRLKCYEEIGGFIPIPPKFGGDDAIVQIKARMKGWQVRSFPEIKVLHHRRTWTATHSIFSARFYGGILQYSLGYHWLFVLVRSLYKTSEKPYFLGSLLTFCGFCWSRLRSKERIISDDVIKFLRREQLNRLLSIFSRRD